MQQLAINQFSILAAAPSIMSGGSEASPEAPGFAGLLAGQDPAARNGEGGEGSAGVQAGSTDQDVAQIIPGLPPTEMPRVSLADGQTVRALPAKIEGLSRIDLTTLASGPSPDAYAIEGAGIAGRDARPSVPAISPDAGEALPRSVGAAIRAFLAGTAAPAGMTVAVESTSGQATAVQTAKVATPGTGSPPETTDPNMQRPVQGEFAVRLDAGTATASVAPTVAVSTEQPARDAMEGASQMPAKPASTGEVPTEAVPEIRPASADMPVAPEPAAPDVPSREASPSVAGLEVAREPAAISGQGVASASAPAASDFRPTAARGSAETAESRRMSESIGSAGPERTAASAPAAMSGQSPASESGQSPVGARPADAPVQPAMRQGEFQSDAGGMKADPAGATQQGSAQPQIQTSGQPAPQTVVPQAQVSAAPDASSSQSATGNAPQQPSTPPSPATNMVGLSIARAVADGQSRFTVRLDPPELGRVDIRLEMSGDGAVRAVIRADSQETLDLLQRDARQLERALADSGLKTESGSLNFSLNQQGQGGRSDTFGQPGGQAAGPDDETAPDMTMARDADADETGAALRLSGLEIDSVDIMI